MKLSKFCLTYCDDEIGIIYNTKNNKKIFINKTEFYNIVYKNNFENVINEFEQNDFFDETDFKVKNVNYYREDLLKIRIFTTMNCNAKCSYCYENKLHKFNLNYKDYSDDLLNFITNNITKRNFKKISIEWFGGEPLLNYKLIRDLSNKLKDKNIKFKSSIVTNGSLLNKNIIDDLINNCNLYNIQISLDAIGNEYNHIKKFNYDAFKDIEKNIGYISNNFENVRILIRTNYSLNIENALNLIEYFGKKKYRNLKIGCFPVFNDNSNEDSIFLKEHFNYLIIEKLFDFGFINIKEILPKNLKYPCVYQSAAYYSILPNGEVYSCDRSYTNSIGNIKSGILNIEKNVDIPKKCKECKFYLLCLGGCEYERKLGKSGCEFTEKIMNDYFRLALKAYKRMLHEKKN